MPAVSELKPSDLEKFKKEEEFVVVAVFPEGSTESKLFQELAEEHRYEYAFAKLAPGIHVLKNGIHALKSFDGGSEAQYNGEMKKESIAKWLSVESTPLMAEVTPENYSKYMSAGLPMAYLFYEGATMRSTYGPIVEEVVKAYKGKINAVYIDAEKFHAHGKALMLPEKWPGFVIHEMEGDLKYPFTGTIGKEELAKFMESYVNGKIEPSYRSEEIPTKDEGPVTTVVFKNFENIVMDDKKDVLIELYAPWCGACKRLAPIYDALAKTYAPHKDKIVIAKMDATTNDIPKSAGIKLTKFPTLVLFKAGSKKEQVEFDKGADSVKTLVDFISSNAVNKVEIKEIENPANETKETKEKEEL